MGAQSFYGSPAAPIPLRINKNLASTTDLITAVAGKSIRAYGIRINVAGAVIVTILDGATVLEVFNFAAAGGGTFLDLREMPYYTTTAGNALRMTLSAAIQVDGVVEYAIGN